MMTDSIHTEASRHFEEFERDGFTIVDEVISAEEIAVLKAAVADALDRDWKRFEGRPGKAEFICLDLVDYQGPFLGLLDNDAYHSFFDTVLSPFWTLYSFTSTVVRPSANTTRQYTCEIHTDTDRVVNGVNLAALGTLALDDFTFDNGTTWFLPGSHRGADRPSEDYFYEHAVRYERPAGSVAFFHPRIWHAGGENRTATTRFGCTIYACLPFMKPRLDYPRLTASFDLGDTSARTRRVLGYDSRIPTNLDEFYVPASERLYKGGQG